MIPSLVHGPRQTRVHGMQRAVSHRSPRDCDSGLHLCCLKSRLRDQGGPAVSIYSLTRPRSTFDLFSNPSPWLLCPLCSVAVERKMQSLRSKECLERRLAFFFTSLLLLPAACAAGVVGGDYGFWGLPTRRASQAARTSAQVPAHKQATCRATTVQR